MSLGALLRLVAILAVSTGVSVAQTVEQLIDRFDSGHRLSRPAQMALSPSGGGVAISDQSAGLIYVTDPAGVLQWLVGEALQIGQPVAVIFDGENRVLFSAKGSNLILGVSRSIPNQIDTVADLTDKLPSGASIDQLLLIPGGFHLVLDRTLAAIYRLKPNWDLDKTLVARGDRKGELWAPTSMAVDLSGNIIVADEGSYPVQTFSRDGHFLFQGSWNSPQTVKSWTGGAVCVTRDDLVWVADISGARWRIFDRTGNEVSERDFVPPLFRPNAMIVLPDNRILVAEERGVLVVLKPE
jgi:hypothetical protein